MAKKMFRSTTVLLALMIALMGLFAFALIGCESVDTDKDTKPTRVRADRVVFDDGAGKTYEMWISDIKTVYYEYEQGKRYRFGFTIYDKDNKPLDPDVLSSVYDPDSLTIEADKPGEHEIHIDIYGDGWDYAVLKVIVKEKPRLTPEVSFDPKGAIDYVPNEKYVYKYDGGRHFPHALLSYNGTNIELDRHGPVTFGVEGESVIRERDVQSYGIDVGVYIAYYTIADYCMKYDFDKGKYSSVSVSVIVEIVE